MLLPLLLVVKTREQRFLAKVWVGPDDCCWFWIAAATGSKGLRGRFHDGERTVYAHRWAYERWVGPIPDGYEVDHTCKQGLCVNPTHLEAVTPKENSDRERLSVCRKGHDLTLPGAVYWHATTGRRSGCVVCRRARGRSYRKGGVPCSSR